MKKKKIAIFHCGFIYTGGGERIVLEEIKGLKKIGYVVECFVPVYDSILSYPDIIKDFKIKTFLPQLPKSLPFRFAISMLTSCLLSPFFAFRFLKYDIIFGANQPGAYIAWIVSNILRKPYFVYLSQPNRILYPRNHEDWQNVKDYYLLNKIINKFFRFLVSYLDHKSITRGKNLFINGSFIAKDICKIYKPEKWIDCPAGAHVSSEKVLKNDRFSGVVKVNHLNIKKPYILFTSRHEPWKKFDWAIEVISRIIKKYPNIKLVIPGRATSVTPKLKKLSRELGLENNIIFTGAITQKELKILYENAAVYIFTSPEEDLGIVVQEAQAAGVPVVTWKNGGPTITVVDEKTGFLIKPNDLSSMSQAIIKLLEDKDLRNKMGENAWQHIKNNFSWEKHMDILEGEFKKLYY